MTSGTDWARSLLRERAYVLAIALGAVVGVLALIDPRLPLLALVFVGSGLIGLYYPDLMLPVLFGSIFAEESGHIEMMIAGVQLTASKLVVLGILGVTLVRSMIERRAVLEWLPTTWGYIAVLASMIFGIGVAGKVTVRQLVPTFGVVLLTILAHLIPRLLNPTRVRWTVRLMSVIAFLILLSNVSATPIESAYQERYTGAFMDPNMWSMSLLLVTPLCVANMAEEDNNIWTLLLVGMVGLVLVNIFQSLSRSGMLGLLAIAPILVWLCWPRRWAFFVGIGIAVVLLGSFVSVDAMSDRYATLVDPDMTEADGSLQLRSLLARTAWHLWLDHPWFGTGQGTFIESAMRYTNGSAYMITHNTYLNVAAELGLQGIIAHAFFYILIVREGVLAALRSPTRRLRRLIVGYGAGMLAFALISMTLNNMQFAMAYFMVGIGTVLARASYKTREELDEMGLGEPGRLTDESAAQSAAA